MREVQAAGAQLAVREWGADKTRKLLFWHALGPSGSGEAIVEVAPPLVARGFDVLASTFNSSGEVRIAWAKLRTSAPILSTMFLLTAICMSALA